jgi:uncharacterized iron-regulated membrane protein
VWQRWLRQPQSLLVRKVLFQAHLWTGIASGLYVVMICLTGSVLVYRNELYRTFSPSPKVVTSAGAALTVQELTGAAQRAYPTFQVTDVRPGEAENHAVEMTLTRDGERLHRLFHPFTGEDLGNPLPAGFRFTAWLLDLHDNLLAGNTGRRVNGIGAVLLVLLCLTGAVIWWPGSRSWRRSLMIDLRSQSKRLTWRMHSALGFWFFGFILLWGVTGAYLAFPDAFAAVFDRLEPLDETNPADRIVDSVQYWLAYLHFGRLGGRGIPGCGRGWCDSITKAMWAAAGLVPAVMFVTGLLMWWSRVLRPGVRQSTGTQSVEGDRAASV